jgi:ribonucleoside-diphosphate reductase alpha chain
MTSKLQAKPIHTRPPVSTVTHIGPRTQAADNLHSMKYRGPGEDYRECINRICFALKDNDNHYHATRDIVLPMRFMFGGRIQSAMGAIRQVTAFNCFASGTILDSYVDGNGCIMQRAHEAATTMRMGGGIGYDFSTLRPAGDAIKRLGSLSTGPMGFAPIFNAVCLATASAGHRRGAQMGMLRCLDGDTLIHTLSGLVKIKDLVGTRPYVYACDSDSKKVRIIQAEKIFVSGRNRKIVRVLMDNLQWVDCTPDHLFMLKSGKYCEAQNLVRGDSLMAIEHAINKHGSSKRFVRTIGCTGGRAEYEHRIVARDVKGEQVSSNWHAHHLNEDSCDNDPMNIEMVNRSEHAKQHDSNLEIQRKRIAQERKGRTRAELYGSEKAEEWERKRQESRGFKIKNHRVIDVIELEKKACEVYDITLTAFHNFAANGVFVHNCDHPDIEAFVRAKQNTSEFRGFNFSIAVTDAFMEAALSGKSFDLRFGGPPPKHDEQDSRPIYRTIDAGALWEMIMRSTWDWGEPGVIFIDRINQKNNLWYCEEIACTNPCSEQPLPPFGACLLGSYNVVQYLRPNPQPRLTSVGNPRYYFDWDQLAEDIPHITRAMDNVTDKAIFPLPMQKAEAVTKRRMGIGVAGLANAGEALSLPYGSPGFIEFEERLYKTILNETYRASSRIAKEKGSFPLYDAERYQQNEFFSNLDEDVQFEIKKDGIRNSHLTSTAPTGTISLCADNISSGVEPVFEYFSERDINTPDGQVRERLADFGYEFLGVQGRLSSDVTVDEHLSVLLTAQKYTDSAVSKTINMDGNVMDWGDFKDIYRRVWEGGGKGCATFNKSGLRMGMMTKATDEGEVCTVDLNTGKRNCE